VWSGWTELGATLGTSRTRRTRRARCCMVCRAASAAGAIRWRKPQRRRRMLSHNFVQRYAAAYLTMTRRCGRACAPHVSVSTVARSRAPPDCRGLCMAAVCGGVQVAAQALGEVLPAAVAAQPSSWPPFAAVLLLGGDEALRRVRRHSPHPARLVFHRTQRASSVTLSDVDGRL
jgi:hypothetical protein